MFTQKALPSLITELITECLTWGRVQVEFCRELENPEGRSLSLTFYWYPAQQLKLHLFNLGKATLLFSLMSFLCLSASAHPLLPLPNLANPLMVNTSPSSSKKRTTLTRASLLSTSRFTHSVSLFICVCLGSKTDHRLFEKRACDLELKVMSLSPASLYPTTG